MKVLEAIPWDSVDIEVITGKHCKVSQMIN
jgi:hypothetical protein